MTASAPLVLSFDRALLPYGPDRVTVRLAARSAAEHMSRVVAPERGEALLVDPSLDAPAADEGPLGPAAGALRSRPPRRAVELTTSGPHPPPPGAGEALAQAALGVLERVEAAPPPERRPDEAPAGGGETPAERAVASGRPVTTGGEALSVAPERLAWLDAALVLYHDPVEGEGPPLVAAPPPPRGGAEPPRAEEASARGDSQPGPPTEPHAEPPAPLEASPPPSAPPSASPDVPPLASAHVPPPSDLLGPADPVALVARFDGVGLHGRSRREELLLAALAAAGLRARWPLGAGRWLALVREGSREAVMAAASARGLVVFPFRASAVRGREVTCLEEPDAP